MKRRKVERLIAEAIQRERDFVYRLKTGPVGPTGATGPVGNPVEVMRINVRLARIEAHLGLPSTTEDPATPNQGDERA